MWRESPGSNYVTMLGKEEVREEVDYKDYVSNKKKYIFCDNLFIAVSRQPTFCAFSTPISCFFSLSTVSASLSASLFF